MEEKTLYNLINAREKAHHKGWCYHVEVVGWGWQYFRKYDDMLFYIVSGFLKDKEISEPILVYDSVGEESTVTYKKLLKMFSA